jgi:hypothetical protein
MKLLPLILLVVCCSASADWMKVSESIDGNKTIFIDPQNVKSNGDKMRVWVLLNNKKKGDYGELSFTAFEEHDCLEGSYRILQITFFSGPMAGGKALHSTDSIGTWSFIRPDSLASAPHNWLCRK